MTKNFLESIQRELIGFQHVFKNLETPLYPPHNVIKNQEGYTIEIAVAGFHKSEIDVYQDHDYGLVVKGTKKESEDSNHHYIYRGIAARHFKKTFPLAPHIKVVDVVLEDGMLYIDLSETTDKKQIKFEVR